MIYGGKKYKAELAKTGKLARLVRQLRDAGKAISIVDSVVDGIESNVQNRTKNTDCDDQHIIALLGAAKCSLLCSVDNRSFKYVKDRSLYPEGVPRVKIYTALRNRKLLKRTDPACLMNVESVSR